MKYYLTDFIYEKQEFYEISEDIYKNLLLSKSNLFQVLFIEEKLDLVVENYTEYEMELLNSSIHQMLYHNNNWSSYSNDINRISRRIVNLLTTSRLYLDHIIHHLNILYGSNNNKTETIKTKISSEYDSNLSYRIIYALRNYVQHRGFPIHGCNYNAVRTEDKNSNQGNLLYTVTPYINADKLEEDKGFKEIVLDEIKELGDKIDIKPIVRGFIDSVGNIHQEVRAILNADILLWEKCLFETVKSFNNRFGREENKFTVHLLATRDNGEHEENTTIFKDFIEQRKSLEMKNRNFNFLSSRFVTSQSF